MKPTPPTLKTIEKPAERLGVALYGEEQPAGAGEIERFLAIVAAIIRRDQEGVTDEKSSGIHPREQ